MRFRFIGLYTNGHTTINASGFVFVMHDPLEVNEPEAIRRLIHHPEFEVVHPLDHDANGKKGGSKPRRKRKVD